MTLDDKRTPIEANDLPDVLARWQSLAGDRVGEERAVSRSPGDRVGEELTTPGDRVGEERAVSRSPEHSRPRTAQSFLVPKQEIVDNGYDLSLNRYKELEIEEVEHRSPQEILDELDALEVEIQDGLKRLRKMLA